MIPLATLIRRVPALALVWAGVLAGCGHGTYTTKAIGEAEQRMKEIKSATEWDLAQQRFEAGDLESAIQSVDRSIALNPDVAKSHLLRGRILHEMGRPEDALAALETGRKLDEKNADFLYYRGVILESVGQEERALEAYTAAAALAPDEIRHTLAAAEVLVQQERISEARALLGAQLEKFEFSPGVHQLLGHICMLENDPSAAAEHFRQASVLGVESPAILEDLARAEIAASRFADADATLARLTRLKGYETRRDLQHMRARCLIELRRPVEARQILTGLTKGAEGASDVEAWARLADIAVMIGDDRQLRAAAQRLIAVAPDRYEGYLALAVWQRKSGDLAAALRSAERAAELAPSERAPLQLKDLLTRQLRGGQAAGI
ncbi:MAG: tetratricopeptide repeat protein [Planctomycetota bacterium]|nr:tetratricopeptide repeat protein [Planctomycetota bacterium]